MRYFNCQRNNLWMVYWHIGQFSRFVRPGAVRLGTLGWTTDLGAAAFENPDGSRDNFQSVVFC